ncbi:M20/M25/M40 family metallo-hydrolase [Ruminococcaceae bacterium OttesenSCG-928-A11]|nr:M20/M25/M40 family metallo-hydrolase [Ruminococcaceae bacterium OttesenSCG-928-A11]
MDAHFDEMVAELKELCAFRSVAGDAAGLEAARTYITGKMTAVGLSPVRHPVPGGNDLISAEMPGETADTLLFYNHYDVVEAGDPAGWRTADPFTAEVEDGLIYARGISDNKGPLLSRLHAVQALLAVCGRLPAGVKFLYEGDEESSSESMQSFAEAHPETFKELIKSDVCLWENGRKDTAGYPWARFGVRGGCAFDLSVTTAKTDVHGRSGSTIPSASWRLVWALASLKSPDEKVLIDGFYDRVIPPTEEDYEVLRAFPYDEEGEKRELGLKSYLKNATGEELKRMIYLEPSFSICGLEAGEMYRGVRGIVPHTASARISFYLVADQDPAELAVQLRRHLDKHGFADVAVKSVGGSSRPVRTPVNIPFRDRVVKAAAKVYEKPMVIELTMLGASPASILRDAWPTLPIVCIGPGNTTANHHAPDENMALEDYREGVKHIIALLYSYLEG